MSIKATAADLTALPLALLSIAKSHMRVDYAYDDDFIKSAIARAISWFERVSGMTVNETTYEWTPAQTEFCEDKASVPVTPVNDFEATSTDTPDVTADFTVTTDSVHGVLIYTLNGKWVTGLKLTIESGFAVADLPAGVLDAVLRYTAHLYENREITAPSSFVPVPDWMTEVMATYWRPRV